MNQFFKSRNQAIKDAPQPLETVVTFLEMTTRPRSTASLPLNSRANIIAARQPTLHFYRYLYYQVGNEWNWEARLRMNDAALETIITALTTDIRVLYVDGVPSGFFEINRADPQVTDLAYFGIMRHAFGRGLGKWFLSAAIEACWEIGPDKITVNTCTLDHRAALPLYQKMGFTPTRRANGRVFPLSDSERAALAVQEGVGL